MGRYIEAKYYYSWLNSCFALILQPQAQMAELVDALDSKSGYRKVVQVRFLFWAQTPFQQSWRGVLLCERVELTQQSESNKTTPAPQVRKGFGYALLVGTASVAKRILFWAQKTCFEEADFFLK